LDNYILKAENVFLLLDIREFSIQCPRCDMPLHLDGPLEKAHCNSCQSDIDVPRSYWIETLANSCRKMQETDPGMGTSSMLIGTFHGDLTLARFDPYCDNCRTSFEDPWVLPHGTIYTCKKCGAVYPVQSPPGCAVRLKRLMII